MAKAKKSEGRRRKLRDFSRWEKRLIRSAQKAFDAEQASQSVLRPRERADNVFVTRAYGYLRELKRAGLTEELRAYVQARDGGKWRKHRSTDELWVIRLVAKGKQDDRMRKKRDRWAADLKLADVNDVRPDLLLGFLFEAGPTELIEQDAKREVRYSWAECYRQPIQKPARKAPSSREDSDDPDPHWPTRSREEAETDDGGSWNDDAHPGSDYDYDYDDEEPRVAAGYTYGKTYGMP